MSARLRRHAALGMAAALMAVVRPALRPEEVRDAFDEFVGVIEEHLEVFVTRYERERRRLRPLGEGSHDESGG